MRRRFFLYSFIWGRVGYQIYVFIRSKFIHFGKKEKPLIPTGFQMKVPLNQLCFIKVVVDHFVQTSIM